MFSDNALPRSSILLIIVGLNHPGHLGFLLMNSQRFSYDLGCLILLKVRHIGGSYDDLVLVLIISVTVITAITVPIHPALRWQLKLLDKVGSELISEKLLSQRAYKPLCVGINVWVLVIRNRMRKQLPSATYHIWRIRQSLSSYVCESFNAGFQTLCAMSAKSKGLL